MAPPKTVTPPEALAIVTSECQPPRERTLSVDEIRGFYLAAPLRTLPMDSTFPGDPPGTLRAAWDGLVLREGVKVGDELRIRGVSRSQDPPPAELPAPGATYRVECGARLTADVHAVLPVTWFVLVGSERARVVRLPAPGAGVAGRGRDRARSWETGTRIDAPLQAFLLGRGIAEVRVHEKVRVGILLVGDELTDLGAQAGEGEQQDLNGFWLGEMVGALGLDVIPLGIHADAPEAVRKVFLRCRARRVDVLLATGGIGDGVHDRLGEAVRGMDSHVFFERLALEGISSLLFAKVWGMDILGMSGRPLAAAATYELFARPLLLARQGAASRYWDWRECSYPSRTEAPTSPTIETWRLWGASLGPDDEHAAGVLAHCWQPESLFSPVVAGVSGWALQPPDGTPSEAVFFQPLSG